MARKTTAKEKRIEALTHDKARRKNIPTAEHQSKRLTRLIRCIARSLASPNPKAIANASYDSALRQCSKTTFSARPASVDNRSPRSSADLAAATALSKASA